MRPALAPLTRIDLQHEAELEGNTHRCADWERRAPEGGVSGCVKERGRVGIVQLHRERADALRRTTQQPGEVSVRDKQRIPKLGRPE